MASHGFQFVVNSAQSATNTSPPSSQRIARAHAARSAHARARRQRTIEYQAQKARNGHHKEPGCTHNAESSCPLVSGPNRLLTYHRRDPFMSCVRKLKPTEEVLFDHYVTVIVPLMRCNAFDPAFYRRMMLAWIPFALAHQGMVELLFLSASRHLIECYEPRQQHRPYSRMAFQYKAGIAQSLREAISAETPNFSDATIIKAIMMAYDELWTRDATTMERHINGAVQMVTLKGGLHTLGLDGFIERLLFNLIAKINKDVGLSITDPWDPRVTSVELM
ncbi:uncharacterized protein BDV17DRAFT_160110 [Aspergillus undulatus]|uniref:uncharacterized protein n=1 Tax=Aspergillus undulatus TaxID=1810928 RepID=UPI003CCE1C11